MYRRFCYRIGSSQAYCSDNIALKNSNHANIGFAVRQQGRLTPCSFRVDIKEKANGRRNSRRNNGIIVFVKKTLENEITGRSSSIFAPCSVRVWVSSIFSSLLRIYLSEYQRTCSDVHR